MKKIKELIMKLQGLSKAITRFPLTVIFLLMTTILINITIYKEENYYIQIITCMIGVVLCSCLQIICERFFYKSVFRILLLCSGVIITVIYYMFVRSFLVLSEEMSVRTYVALLALLVGFLWIPTIRARVTFNESFMIAFKSFFHSIFYGGVIFGGVCFLIAATNFLIVSIESRAYLYTLNMVFVLFVPVFFLSLIPIYPINNKKMADKENQREEVIQEANCPKFLEGLISYILIPLIIAYTAILILYILLNITGEFWKNNLLEPLAISYAIIGILLYILSSNIKNKITVLFRVIFPKILIPIMIVQIIATFLGLGYVGIIPSRYVMILAGVYFIFSGIIMCIVSVRKNGILAGMLIVFLIISISPPIDVFTISRNSQISILQSVLEENKMLANNTITPNESISDEDKGKIYKSVEYLDRMEYIEEIEWIPKDFNIYRDFKGTFGFHEYGISEDTRKYINVYLNSSKQIDIKGYDSFVHAFITSDEELQQEICKVEESGKVYTIYKEKKDENDYIVFRDDQNGKIISFNCGDIFSRYLSFPEDKSELEMDQAIFTVENEKANIKIIVQNASIEESADQSYYYVDFNILISIF